MFKLAAKSVTKKHALNNMLQICQKRQWNWKLQSQIAANIFQICHVGLNHWKQVWRCPPLLVTRIDRIKKHLSMFSNFLTSNKISNQLKYLKLKSSTWSVTCSECKYRLLRFVHHTASPQIIDVIEKVTVGGFNPPPRNSWHFDPSKLIYHLERIDGDRHSHVLL